MCFVAQLCPTFAALWTVALQAPLSMGFSWQEYCRGLPFLPPVGLPDPGIRPGSPALQALCQLNYQEIPPPPPIINKNTYLSLRIHNLFQYSARGEHFGAGRLV